MLASATLDRAALEALPSLAPEDADWARVQRTTYAVQQFVHYAYPGPIRDLRQRLLLVPPRQHGDQRTLSWGIEASQDARRRDWKDRFGNTVVNFEVDTVERSIGFEAWSLIERHSSESQHRLRANSKYALPTPLTTADSTLAAAAAELAGGDGSSGAGTGGLDLAERICDWVYRSMVYRHDVTSIDTTAAMALAIGAGVCQDYAHIALALCRRCGLPARYVSGHLLGEGGSHAWIEVMIPDPHRPSVWQAMAIDPTHNCRPALTYLTVAVGRDYRDVAPTSGSYRAPVSGNLSVRKQASLVAVVYRGE